MIEGICKTMSTIGNTGSNITRAYVTLLFDVLYHGYKI